MFYVFIFRGKFVYRIVFPSGRKIFNRKIVSYFPSMPSFAYRLIHSSPIQCRCSESSEIVCIRKQSENTLEGNDFSSCRVPHLFMLTFHIFLQGKLVSNRNCTNDVNSKHPRASIGKKNSIERLLLLCCPSMKYWLRSLGRIRLGSVGFCNMN